MGRGGGRGGWNLNLGRFGVGRGGGGWNLNLGRFGGRNLNLGRVRKRNLNVGEPSKVRRTTNPLARGTRDNNRPRAKRGRRRGPWSQRREVPADPHRHLLLDPRQQQERMPNPAHAPPIEAQPKREVSPLARARSEARVRRLEARAPEERRDPAHPPARRAGPDPRPHRAPSRRGSRSHRACPPRPAPRRSTSPAPPRPGEPHPHLDLARRGIRREVDRQPRPGVLDRSRVRLDAAPRAARAEGEDPSNPEEAKEATAHAAGI